MELYFPVRNPLNQSNPFGAKDPRYTSMGLSGHPGIDFECPMYTPIYAAQDGDAFYAYDKYHGDGLYVRFPNNAKPTASIIYWHMPDKSDTAHWVLPTGPDIVTPVKKGQLIGYTGNSGFPQESNGPHLHFAYMPCGPTGAPLNPNNGYGGCEDPMPFFNHLFAQDISAVTFVVQETAQIIPQITASDLPTSTKQVFFQKVAQFLTQFLHVLQLE